MANIVWDIDGVCVDINKYLLDKGTDYFKNKFNRNIENINGITAIDMFGCTEEEEIKFWKSHLNLLTYSQFQELRPGLKETMETLHANGDKNIICSARAKCCESNLIGRLMRFVVTNWLKQLPIDEIYFVSPKNSAREKLEICRKVNATTIIEDDLENIELLRKEFPTIYYHVNSDINKVNLKNVLPACNFDELYLQVEKIKKPDNYSNFRFLDRKEREQLKTEDLEKYYIEYRKVMLKMPYDQNKRVQQEKKYEKLYYRLYKLHSIFASKTIVINPDMLNYIQKNCKEGKIFTIASHTTMDDIQQVEKTLGDMAYFLVKKEIIDYPIIGKFVESLGCIPVKRDQLESRRYSRNQAEKLLLRDKDIIILPEGTRNRTQEAIAPFEKGALSIAHNTGKTLVPIAMKRFDIDAKEVYLKIGTPRKIQIGVDLSIETHNLEQEMKSEILSINQYVYKKR